MKPSRILAITVYLVIVVVMTLGVFTLPRHTWPIWIPLFIYTACVSIPAMLFLGEDYDILRIRAMIAADFRSVTSAFLRTLDGGEQYELKAGEIEQMRKVPLASDSSIQRVQTAYWTNRRFGRRLSEKQLLVANFILLLVGAAIGDVVENQLVPDAEAIPPLWGMGPLGLIALLFSVLAFFLAMRRLLAFYRAMERQEHQNFDTIRSAMTQRPQEVAVTLLSSLNNKARYKLAEELKYASYYLDSTPGLEESLIRLRGYDREGEWRPSGLMVVCLTNFSFGIGLILGAYLPPLLGLAR